MIFGRQSYKTIADFASWPPQKDKYLPMAVQSRRICVYLYNLTVIAQTINNRFTEIFSQLIVNAGKTVFMTTHNPLVLDGLNLADDRIRLFAVNRSRSGYVQLKRIRISDELLQTGQSLSRLWINGMLGGVPELI